MWGEFQFPTPHRVSFFERCRFSHTAAMRLYPILSRSSESFFVDAAPRGVSFEKCDPCVACVFFSACLAPKPYNCYKRTVAYATTLTRAPLFLSLSLPSSSFRLPRLDANLRRQKTSQKFEADAGSVGRGESCNCGTQIVKLIMPSAYTRDFFIDVDFFLRNDTRELS